MLVVLAFLSFLGICGMTILFPLLAAVVRVPSSRCSARSSLPRNISILVPAHNEEALLPATLFGMREAIQETRKQWNCHFRILVGADGCTDKTEQVAREMGIEVVSMSSKTGKWGTLSNLVTHCAESEWTILADCGVSWPRNFLTRLAPFLVKEDTIGVAPTYRNNTSGMLEKLVWRMESVIKRIELRSGGPVSVHGATVCYRTKELASALDFLSRRHWLNDDIVIPLALRALYPTKRLVYVGSLAVTESPKPARYERSEFRRRRRLVVGNIQWIAFLWGPVWRYNSVAAILACRRVFRLLWAYWAAFACLAVVFCLGIFSVSVPCIVGLTMVCMVAVVYDSQLKAVFESSLASILAPYYLLSTLLRPPISSQETSWN